MAKAEIGGKAQFTFASGTRLFGIIEYIPVNVGESWIITEFYEGRELGTVYINQFETMHLRCATKP